VVFSVRTMLRLYKDNQLEFSVVREWSSSQVLHQVVIGFSDLNETCVEQSGFYGLHFMYCVHGQLLFCESGIGEVCHLAAIVCSAV
jgi:hypothetical protein